MKISDRAKFICSMLCLKFCSNFSAKPFPKVIKKNFEVKPHVFFLLGRGFALASTLRIVYYSSVPFCSF